jgi:hypothetical protein
MNTNNKIIAEFLGIKTISEQDFLNYNYNTNEIGNMHILESKKYDTDWNQLMEVVEKIESLGYTVKVAKYIVIIDNPKNKGNHIAFRTDWEHTKIQAVYNACLDFIKWYNEQS